jgi:hypothetical protein
VNGLSLYHASPRIALLALDNRGQTGLTQAGVNRNVEPFGPDGGKEER